MSRRTAGRSTSAPTAPDAPEFWPRRPLEHPDRCTRYEVVMDARLYARRHRLTGGTAAALALAEAWIAEHPDRMVSAQAADAAPAADEDLPPF